MKAPVILFRALAIASLSVAVVACGDDDEPSNTPDAGTDVGDTGGGDASSDTGTDTDPGTDADPDTDPGIDVAPDADADPGTDADADVVEPGPTIVDLAVATDFLSTLVAAVTAADLVGTLSGAGPFTVFAPTDDAFAALPAGALDDLLADVDALTEVLLYHVVSGTLLAADVVAADSVTTLQGGDLDVVVSGETVTVGGATVTATDILATNGVVHVIDTVLLPPDPGPGNIAEVATEAGNFTTLLAALTAAGLADAVATTEDITVFAPTDAAFALLPEGTVEALLDDIPALTEILTYHVVTGRFAAEAVVGESLLPTLLGTLLKVAVDGETVTVGGAVISVTDIEASNGIIHVIDAVIMPPGTIVDVAVEADDFETLVAAVTAAELVDTLSGEGPFTVFAPTDAAFAALPEGTLEALLDDIPTLTSILLYHVAAGALTAADVVELSTVATVNGAPAPIVVDGASVTIDGATIVVTDIPASNGIIHVIDAVILPPEE